MSLSQRKLLVITPTIFPPQSKPGLPATDYPKMFDGMQKPALTSKELFGYKPQGYPLADPLRPIHEPIFNQPVRFTSVCSSPAICSPSRHRLPMPSSTSRNEDDADKGIGFLIAIAMAVAIVLRVLSGS